MSDCKFRGSHPNPDKVEWIFTNGEDIGLRHALKAHLLIPQHAQQRSPQFMRFQLPLGVKPEHESMEIAAFFLQLPLAPHFHERQDLSASGTDGVV
jgi:hypothetical protein